MTTILTLTGKEKDQINDIVARKAANVKAMQDLAAANAEWDRLMWETIKEFHPEADYDKMYLSYNMMTGDITKLADR